MCGIAEIIDLPEKKDVLPEMPDANGFAVRAGREPALAGKRADAGVAWER